MTCVEGEVSFRTIDVSRPDHPGTASVGAASPATVPPTALLAIVLGVLFGLAGTSTSGVTVVLPQLAEQLDVSTAAATWVVSAYAVALAVATPLHGRLADIVGIRAPLCGGAILMVAGALGAAAAPNLAVLLVARVAQGLGAASVPVLASALLSARLEGPRRGAALGRLAGTSATLSALGPLIGGALEALGGWRAAVALPAVALLAVPYLWRRSDRARRRGATGRARRAAGGRGRERAGPADPVAVDGTWWPPSSVRSCSRRGHRPSRPGSGRARRASCRGRS